MKLAVKRHGESHAVIAKDNPMRPGSVLIHLEYCVRCSAMTMIENE